MLNLLCKELKLSASILSYLFIGFALLAFCPGYPILAGAFFVCLGLFQSFQSMREANDILYSALLPVSKADVVRSKYVFCMFIELCAVLLGGVVVAVRMTVLSDLAAYRTNALMNANPVFLGFSLLIYGCFNAVFVCGFFKTADAFARPFIRFIIAAFLLVGVGETLHHIPGMEALNAFGFEHFGLQISIFAAGAVGYILLTCLSMRRAIAHFEKIDL